MSILQVANVILKDGTTRIDVPVAGSLAFTANSANALYLSNSLVTIPGSQDLIIAKDLAVTGNVMAYGGRAQSNAFIIVPQLTFGGGNTGITTSARLAYVVIEPHQVTIIGNITLTSKGSSTGTAIITHAGLPNVDSSGGAASINMGYYSAFAANARPQGYCTTGTNPAGANVTLHAPDVVALTQVHFNNNSDIIYSVRYRIN